MCACACAINNAYKRWWYLPICFPNQPASCLSSYCLTGGNWHSSLMWLHYLCVCNNARHAAVYLPMCSQVSPKMCWNNDFAVAAACVVYHCGVICQPLAAVCRASVDLKPVITSRHRAASYRETEYRSQIVFCHTVTQTKTCRIFLMDHKLSSFVHVKQVHVSHACWMPSTQNVRQMPVIYTHP